jgi:hypothetical protein
MTVTVDGRAFPIEATFDQGVDAWLGGNIHTIYSQARLDGYQAGLRVYAECEAREERGEKSDAPADILTDQEFLELLDLHMPGKLTGHDAEVWRASFITGWTCAALEIDSWDGRPVEECTESVFGPRHTIPLMEQRMQRAAAVKKKNKPDVLVAHQAH